MRWPAENPQIGDTREVQRYAWMPTRMTEKDEWVWLEPYWEQQVFTSYYQEAPKWELKRRW